MSGGVLTHAPRACVLLFSGSLLCCDSRLRRIVSMCESKLEIMSVEVWEKKIKKAGGAIGYNALVVGFIFLFHLPSSRLLLGSALSVVSSVDSLCCRRSDTREKHAVFNQSTALNGLQFSYLLHWDMWCVVSRLICGC